MRGFHYIGKSNYNAIKCLGCKNLFCNGMSKNNELSDYCNITVCDQCITGYCNECLKLNKEAISNCGDCGAAWCCTEHKDCSCGSN